MPHNNTIKNMEFLNDLLRGSLGIVVMLAACYLLSKDRKAISWRLVGMGMALQIALAILILKVPFVSSIFDFLAKGFEKVLRFSEAGQILNYE